MINACEAAAKNIQAFKKAPIGKADLLQRSVEFAEKNPRLVVKKFLLYYRTIENLFNLTPKETSIINFVNQRHNESRGADKFLEAMAEKKDVLLAQMRKMGDLDNPHNQKGMTNLMHMMNNAWEIKKTEPNWCPQDGDKRSNEVIWGFVKGADNPEVNIFW